MVPATSIDIPEDDLLPGLRRGDPDAQAAFYRAYFSRVYRWCRWMGGRHVDPEDATAEVFVVAFAKVARFRGEAALSTWLFRIARRVVSTLRRRAWIGRLTGLDAFAGSLRAADNPEALASARWDLAHAQEVLDGLSEAKREAFVLVDICGHTLDEAAAVLRTLPATVGSRAFYARKEFMERYARLNGEVVHDT